MSKSTIPVLDLKPEMDELWSQLQDAIGDVLRSGQFIMGPQVKEFESEVAAYLGVDYAVAMNSGTDALFIALRALGIGPNDEVITTSFTFFATAEAISHVGATPVFVDIDPKTLNLSVDQLEAAITSKTKAIIPVHLFGLACDMDGVLRVAKKYNLRVIEDVAQAFGGSFQGKKLGTIGDVGTYSFFPSKNLGAYGDGGMLVTNDANVAATARMLRSHGSHKKYHNEAVGYNSRLDEIQAAILRVKLPHLEQANHLRREVAARYKSLLADVPLIECPGETADSHHVYHQYTVRIKSGQRDNVQAALAQQGISTMIYYPVPVHKLPVYQGIYGHLPHTERAALEVLSLPIWPQMGIESQKIVVNALKVALDS